MQNTTKLIGLCLIATLVACGGLPTVTPGDSPTSSQGGTHAGGNEGIGGKTDFNFDNTGGTVVTGAGGADAGQCYGTGCVTDSVCGNAIVETNESCDDGNAMPGDGCTGVCRIEPNYTCPVAGQPCILNVVCGDGKVTGNEACDDGNTVAHDGCAADCKSIETGYICRTPGQLCTPSTTPPVCGNSIVEANENCDDGGKIGGDGCSAACLIEDGYTCPTPGSKCILLQYCGDGVLNGVEQCDDGNLKPGDCCDGNCHTEPNCTCSTPTPPLSPPRQVCSSTMVCGDGVVTGTEACDDTNKLPEDGCSADCTTVEPGYTCPKTGGACTKVVLAMCGNAILETGEFCDDGNQASKDGCSSSCEVEPGYVCTTAGQACTLIAKCSDGIIQYQRGETCDDGNLTTGDGCNDKCTIEQGWSCTPVLNDDQVTYKSSCANTTVCGDKKITGAETCDDGNAIGTDGCSSQCQLEDGWVCPVVGAKCRAAKCGDGIIAGLEECDDGDATPGDGCSATCYIETGYVCAGPGKTCHKTTCGDGNPEGSEQCDDGNLIPYDGCSPTCTKDAVCSGGSCTAVCGDGMKFAQEECDDGNTRSGDGCSSKCTFEPGWYCDPQEQTPPTKLEVPILYRDVMSKVTVATDAHPAGHPDFENSAFFNQSGCAGSTATLKLVMDTLGTDNKPQYRVPEASETCRTITSADTFKSWYHNDPLNAVVPLTLTLTQQTGTTTYSFDSGAGFWPLTNLGWQSAASCAPCQTTPLPTWCDQCQGNTLSAYGGGNFFFTSELHYPFTYTRDATNPAQFNFSGDDDVWVFVNQKLALDLGGIHSMLPGQIVLNDATATALGLVEGGMYEIAVFQAERHYRESNYKLTVANFKHIVSVCRSECGDGIVTPDEACDQGKDKNTGAYGGCNADCSLAPYCGDKQKQAANEQCDDGNNTTLYDNSKASCAPGCVLPHYCGDTNIDAAFGEVCDNGPNNSDTAYGLGQCTTTCQVAPYCGDGRTSSGSGEQCDDGLANGTPTSPCDTSCRFKCGNGVPEAGEQCDLGADKNVGGYGGCNADCTRGAYCGDGFKQAPEECDDGKNDGSYGTCKPDCTYAGYCGDGSLQNPPESCDRGVNNSSLAYGIGLCTNQCLPAPYCGNKAVDSQFGEKCDDGVNSGAAGSCLPDCSAWVPLNSCGDGKTDSSEQCDDGPNNGTVLSGCDVHCRIKCGNGVVDPGEQCDDGKNDGSYGTCKAGCTYAGYCGDGVTNGSEQCDLGPRNQADPYGAGTCTTACKKGPYCGDGRVQSAHETCDGQTNCTASCNWWDPLYT